MKHNPDGSSARFKPKLAAKGYHQEHGVDYTETFSPVVKHATISMVLSLTVHFKWPLHHLDVTDAFLHGILQEDIYMTQPVGFVDPCFPNHICKLHKSLYGFKQAPRAWFEWFSNFLIALGFHNSYADSSLFVRHYKGTITIILVYVDDLIFTDNNSPYITHLIGQLSMVFEMKDLGRLHHFLEIEITYTPTGLFLSQSKYARDLLSRTSMLGCKPIGSPCNCKEAPAVDASSLLHDPTSYRNIVGTLQYLTITSPDISFAVNQAC